MDAITAELPLGSQTAPTADDAPLVGTEDGNPRCDHCGEPFTPRKGSGGRPQRFCSNDCKVAFHAEDQRSQCSPTYSAETTLAAFRQPPTSEPTSDDFRSLSDDAVIIPEQQAIACYFNPAGDLVIRQERSWDREEDSFVFVHKSNLAAFLDKLCDICGVGSAP